MHLDRKNTEKIKQVSSLYISMVLSLVVGIGVSVFNTRLLGPQNFGDYKFLQTLFSFLIPFFTFGFFVTGGQLLTQKDKENDIQGLTGTILSVAAIISILFIFFLFIFSFFQESLFSNTLGPYIRIFSPFLFIFPFQLCIINIFQGTNQIYELSFFRIIPSIIYLIFAVVVNFFFIYSLFTALFVQFFALTITIVFSIFLIKPNFKSLKPNFIKMISKNRSYGFPVYMGSILNVTSAQLGGLLVAFFIDNINVGYYALAITIATPLMMIPNVIGTTFFRDFAYSPFIERIVIITTIMLSFISLVFFFLIAETVIVHLYSSEFSSIVPLCYILAVGFILHGMGDFVNRFLGAHGQGIYLRNGALIVGLFNFFGFTFLVHQFGVFGAVYTRLCAGALYFSTMVYYYKKFQGSCSHA